MNAFQWPTFDISEGTKPKITSDMKDVKVIAPKVVTMSCDIEPGSPRATIRWFKDAKEVYQNKKYSMFYDGSSAKLDISPSELGDSAVYRCEADNKVGRVESEATLTVQGMRICGYKNKLWFIIPR